MAFIAYRIIITKNHQLVFSMMVFLENKLYMYLSTLPPVYIGSHSLSLSLSVANGQAHELILFH